MSGLRILITTGKPIATAASAAASGSASTRVVATTGAEEAFRSTLEEVADADLLLHVVDGSHPDPEGQIAAVREVLAINRGLDVSKEPWIVSIPDMKGRYYLFPMLDGWTDVFQVPGKRTTGTGAQTYAITGPGWKGKLPAGVKEYKSPTAIVWLLGGLALAIRLQSAGIATTVIEARDKPGGRLLVLEFSKVAAPLAWFPRLAAASAAQRARWEPAAAGHGIHWPDVDEDLSIAGLLRTTAVS